MSDDRQEPPAGDPDATRALPPDHPAAGTGRTAADADTTQALPPERAAEADATRAMPPAWSGRAGVPTRPAAYPEPGTEWYAEEQAGRRWWMPILLGILALLLLALIGLGVWVALRASERNPAPAPSPTAVPTTAPRTSAAPTTTAPSSSPPTTPPSPTSAEVPMPPLVGLPESAARAILDRLGVGYRVETRESDRPAGTVIETDPAAGEPIGDGDRVTLVVAERTAPTTGASTTAPAPTATATP